MTADNESQWISQAQSGDLKSYSKLATKYQDMIFTLALRMLKNKQDAEDTCQDVLIKIYKNIKLYKSHAPFSAWVYRICFNESINKIRKLKSSREDSDEHINSREDWIETNNILDSFDVSDRKNTIIQAMDSLSDENRFLVMAYYFEELSIKEIEKITELSISNIKIKLHRARKQLYKILSKPAIKERLL